MRSKPQARAPPQDARLGPAARAVYAVHMPKAIRFSQNGGPEVLRLEELDPGKPGAHELPIPHTAIGRNYIDVYDRTGLYPVSLPSGLGREAAGIVTALGRGARGFRVGERVAYVWPRPGAYSAL